MQPDRVIISQHAWLRFKERWIGQEQPRCFYEEIRRLLMVATPEDLGFGSVIRLIKNNFQPAVYYYAENWRFVLDETETMLLTCERIYYKARKPQRHTRRRRY